MEDDEKKRNETQNKGGDERRSLIKEDEMRGGA